MRKSMAFGFAYWYYNLSTAGRAGRGWAGSRTGFGPRSTEGLFPIRTWPLWEVVLLLYDDDDLKHATFICLLRKLYLYDSVMHMYMYKIMDLKKLTSR